jgi:prepilin-type N-terminal cleavage/methylation domain-containing protein
MISPRQSYRLGRRNRIAGFTLVEVMITATIGTIILAGVLTAYIMAARGFRAVSNYWEIHTDGRNAIDRFASDMRGVSTVTSCVTNSSLVVKIPTSFSSSGSVLASKTVTYSYSNHALLRTDSSVGATDMLASNVYQVTFRLYDRVGNYTTVLSNAKAAQLELFLRKYTAGQAQTEDYLAARLTMRNI